MGRGRPCRVSWFPALCGCLHGTIEGTVSLLLASDNKNSLYEEDCGQFFKPKLTLALLSLSQMLWGLLFFFPLTFSGIGVSYFNISASLELTIEARRGHAHSAISSPCLVLLHSPGAPILPLSSLTRKCASVWTLFSSWYLTSGLPRALPSLPSKSLYFALASSFQRSHLLQPLVLPSRKLRLLRQTPLPRTPP